MSKKQDLEALDRFVEFIKKNPDVKDMILNAMDTINQPYKYIFDPMTDGNTERPTLVQARTLTHLLLKEKTK